MPWKAGGDWAIWLAVQKGRHWILPIGTHLGHIDSHVVFHLVHLGNLLQLTIAPRTDSGLTQVILSRPNEFAENIGMIVRKLPLLKRVSWERLRGHHDAIRNASVIF